jgi:hypothetical protein
MHRYLNLADSKGRNAEIAFYARATQATILRVTTEGMPVKSIRVLKGGPRNAYAGLLQAYQSDDRIAEALVSGDPDICLEMTGRRISAITKLYVDSALKPAFTISKAERVFSPEGELKEERPVKETTANILSKAPIRPTGKLFPRKDMATKLVFSKKYQLQHVNGLTFDFLMGIARELHEKDALMMVGGGDKGNEPLVFSDGGKSYRGFLEGRVNGDGYMLLLHLSNLELKPIPG